METRNIEKLRRIEEYRHNDINGYILYRDSIMLSLRNAKDLTTVNGKSNWQFDPYIRAAIDQKFEELIALAYELEEKEYQEIRKLAKLEAVNVLAGEELVITPKANP